jgi:Sec-independent protein translocase protein TatA
MAVVCPECGRTLNVRADLPPGKRIKCPKCATVFAPVGEEDEEKLDDEEEERPRRRRGSRRDDDRDERYRDDDVERRPRRKKPRARRGSSAALIWSLIGGVGALVLIVIVVVVLILVGGGSALSQHEGAMKESLQLMAEFENAMNEVKDQNSARVAAAKIQQLCDRLEALANKVRALPKITPVEAKQLQDKYKAQADGFAQRMQQVGFQAGMNSRGEPSFVAAAQRLVRVGQSLKQMGL